MFNEQEKYGTVGLVHVDAHSDCDDIMLGERIAHGTPFRRSLEEGIIDPTKMVQIGLRGSEYSANCHQWQKDLVRAGNQSQRPDEGGQPIRKTW